MNKFCRSSGEDKIFLPGQNGTGLTAGQIQASLMGSEGAPVDQLTMLGFLSARLGPFVEGGMPAALEGVTGICIGEKTQAAARQLGIPTAVAREATIQSLVDRLVELHQEKKSN